MNTEKFTQGQWVVNGRQVVLSETPCNKRCSGYGCDNDFICDLDDGEYHEYYDQEEMNANAALIAAAPEMYRLLQNFVKWDEDYPVGNNPMKGLYEFNNLISETEKVLKKARGEG